MALIHPSDNLMVLVVRKKCDPVIYMTPGEVSNEWAAELLELMAKRLRREAQDGTHSPES
jgi:hypothetical protein